MPKPIIMPKYEMTQEHGTIVKWVHRDGDRVEKGELILEIETDKVVMEVESPETGILSGIRFHEGDRAPVTEIIAYIFQPGEELPADKEPLRVETAEVEELTAFRHRQSATPVAKRVAEEHGIDILEVLPAKPGRWVTRKDVERHLPADQKTTLAPRPRATPAARRIGRETGIDLWAVQGSGPQARIQAADVMTLEQAAARPDGPEQHTPAQAPQPTEVPSEPDMIEIVPLAGRRRTVAERVQHSYQTAPHITFSIDVDMSEVENLRRKMNRRADQLGAAHISVTACLVKICAWALKHHRWLNATLREDQISLYSAQNIGVAVAVGDDLIVPVIHHVERLSIPEIAALLLALAEQARQGSLTLADVRGGTFTISNLGVAGIDQFTAIINPPQTAILAVGSIKKRAVVVETESGDVLVSRPMLTLTLSADHRVVNGIQAANFLKEIAAVIEDPSLLLS